MSLSTLKERLLGQKGDLYPPWQSAFSLDALRRAWLLVRANKGRSGADGQTVEDFERNLETNLQNLHEELLREQYRPRKVTQVLVPKPRKGWRPLAMWAVRDKVVQRATHDYLEPVFERQFLQCSYGYRPDRSTSDAALAIRQAYLAGARWVLDADIKDCFGQMDNCRLNRQLAKWFVPGPISRLIGRWLEAKVWNAWQGRSHSAGTSQGGVISPLLCNLYLHPFDQIMEQQPDLWPVRYADDFVVLSRKKHAAVQAQKQSAVALKKLGLELHPQKTRITSFDEGFQFVGWFFAGNKFYELK